MCQVLSVICCGCKDLRGSHSFSFLLWNQTIRTLKMGSSISAFSVTFPPHYSVSFGTIRKPVLFLRCGWCGVEGGRAPRAVALNSIAS